MVIFQEYFKFQSKFKSHSNSFEYASLGIQKKTRFGGKVMFLKMQVTYTLHHKETNFIQNPLHYKTINPLQKSQNQNLYKNTHF